MSRQIIIVDIETTGLHEDAAILEVAAINLSTGHELSFVPYVSMDTFANASPDALRINRYFERGVRKQMLTPEATSKRYRILRQWLAGNTLAGANPTFDAGMLSHAKYYNPGDYVPFGMTPCGDAFDKPWHYRLWDLSAYAAGILGLDNLPGLNKVCELLNVENEEEHSALGDARATAECFRQLMGIMEVDIPGRAA